MAKEFVKTKNSIVGTASKRPEDIQMLEVNASDVRLIQKDINLIVLPFFYFSDAKKYEKIEYTFEGDKNKTMSVMAVSGDRVPTSFDYEVFQVLLKFREVMKNNGQSGDSFACTAWNIAKEMKLLSYSKKGKAVLSKNVKERILHSVKRLQRTSYQLQNIYNTKSTDENGNKQYEVRKSLDLSILEMVETQEDLFNSEYSFIIQFSKVFLSSIEKKYHFTYELGKLDAISQTSAKRLFELIDFRRQGKLEAQFKYDEIAYLLPLNSGRKNRILINGYLKSLRDESNVIKDFVPDSPKGYFKVKFIKDTKFRKENLSNSETTKIPHPYDISLFETNTKAKKTLTEEEEATLESYVALQESKGVIKSSRTGYKNVVRQRILEGETTLDVISELVASEKKAEEAKLKKEQDVRKQREQEDTAEHRKQREEALLKEMYDKAKDDPSIVQLAEKALADDEDYRHIKKEGAIWENIVKGKVARVYLETHQEGHSMYQALLKYMSDRSDENWQALEQNRERSSQKDF